VRESYIVIAWVDVEHRPVESPDEVRIDLGVVPRLADVRVPKAVVWLTRGVERDVEDARRFAEKIGETARVFVYPRDEEEPLVRARREVLVG